MKQIPFKAIIIIVALLLSDITFGQYNKELEINLFPREINGNIFDGHLILSIKNISKDTIYITIEPFNYDIINKTEGLSNDLSFSGTEYAPNRIIFLRAGINPSSLDCVSSISFLKFPGILYLYPGRHSDIILNINEKDFSDFKNSNWTILKDIWFADKTVVDKVIKNKPPFIKKEFEESLFYKDIIHINLTSSLQPLINPSVYFYNNLDSCSERGKCNTIYDSVILKCFNNYYIE